VLCNLKTAKLNWCKAVEVFQFQNTEEEFNRYSLLSAIHCVTVILLSYN
jgi:hypothetical protein